MCTTVNVELYVSRARISARCRLQPRARVCTGMSNREENKRVEIISSTMCQYLCVFSRAEWQ